MGLMGGDRVGGGGHWEGEGWMCRSARGRRQRGMEKGKTEGVL